MPHTFRRIKSIPSSASPSKDSCPVQVTVPDTPLESTAMSKSVSIEAPSSWSACAPVMFCVTSPIQDMFATLPSKAVIKLVSRLSFVLTVKSPKPAAYSPVWIVSFASASSNTPAYAETLIFPAGTVYDHSPFSSASV